MYQKKYDPYNEGKKALIENSENFSEDFKITEIGPIPANWLVVKLGEIFDIKQGKSLSPKSREGPRKRPFLRTSNVLWGYIDLSSVDEMHFDEDEERHLSLQPGDLLVCEGGEIGRTAIWEGQLPRCLYQNHLHRLRSYRPDILPMFYMYWMQAAWKILGLYEGSANITTIPNLSRSRLSSLLVPFPPLPEQKAIAHVLRTVQQAKEATEKVIAALKNLKKSLMRHLFTYGPVPLDKVDSVPLRETELGPLPEHWQVVRLGDVARVSSGGSAPQGNHYFGGKNPFVRVQHVDENGYFLKRWDFITDEAVKKNRLKLFPANTIIFPKSGASIRLEKRAILPIAAYLVSHLCAVVSNENQLAHMFLFYALKNRQLASDKAGGYPTISLSEINQLFVPAPPLPEQQEIARILQAVDRRIETEEAYKNALNELFRTLLDILMTGKLRVKMENSEDVSSFNIKEEIKN